MTYKEQNSIFFRYLEIATIYYYTVELSNVFL